MEWISVKDQLPAFEEYVICYYYPRAPLMEGRIIGLLRRIKVSDNSLLRGLADKNQFGMASEVTHWMPLPKPPKDNA